MQILKKHVGNFVLQHLGFGLEAVSCASFWKVKIIITENRVISCRTSFGVVQATTKLDEASDDGSFFLPLKFTG